MPIMNKSAFPLTKTLIVRVKMYDSGTLIYCDLDEMKCEHIHPVECFCGRKWKIMNNLLAGSFH
jgi:hypothetical protein